MKPAVAVAFAMLVACGQRQGPPPAKTVRIGDGDLISRNKEAVSLESKDIDNYIARHGLEMTTSATGLRFRLLRDTPGPVAQAEDLVTVNYSVTLIDGRACYASDPGAPESFRVEHDDVESGLHEGIQLLSPGDSALLIIPSHRAFGLAGDMDKIPMRSTLIYHVGLVNVRKVKP